MNTPARVCRKFLKRHAEVIFIVAFLLADCFLSGWALALGTAAAVLYVLLPAVRALIQLDPLGRITFLKAFVKTPTVHRLGFLLFWIFSIRALMYCATTSRLFTLNDSANGTSTSNPSLSTALFLGAQQFAPAAFLASPFIIYSVACIFAIGLRALLRASKQDPDLIIQRQRWAGAAYAIFLSAFVASILSITLNLNGPGYMLSNWLLASARDANLFSNFANYADERAEIEAAIQADRQRQVSAEVEAERQNAAASKEFEDYSKGVATKNDAEAIKLEESIAKSNAEATGKNKTTKSTALNIDMEGTQTPKLRKDAEDAALLNATAATTAPEEDKTAASNETTEPQPNITSTHHNNEDNKDKPIEGNFFTKKPLLVGIPVSPMLQGVMPESSDMKFVADFDKFILSALSLSIMAIFIQPAMRLHSFLMSFSWRVVSVKSLQNVIEGFLEALRLPSRSLGLSEAHPFLNNATRTLVWLVTCYAFLFWLFGFCGGPLGNAIHNWMMASVVDAGFVENAMDAPSWLFDPKLRIFIGSIVALYGTAPLAISAAVILPFSKPRKIILNNDGILFAQGPFLALWLRQFRLWNDFKSVSVKSNKDKYGQLKAQFKITFRSGGNLTFNNSQMSAQDLRVLLDALDQHAISCTVDSEIVPICMQLAQEEIDKAASDGITDVSISAIPAQQFKSTIFVPFAPGEFIPETRTRIIKLLSSKPLCAVYLGRTEQGRMVTIKQFYLAEDNEETKALAKIMQREYELLTRLDHPGIAKVISSFSMDRSTYLIIEHRLGSDLRSTVQEHGPRSEALTITWAKQLCEIMSYLHSANPSIIHRDLTPDNIIAGEDGQLRLIDFGAAKEFLDGITGTMIGKHSYIAPEQLRGSATIKSDIYSFGCTLYFLLTGRDPKALSQSSPAKNIDCSEEIDKLISDCTEFDEDKRPQNFAEILKRLNALEPGVLVKLSHAKEEVKV